MASVLFKRGNTATISSTAIADGQLLWNTVTGEIWEDIGTSRIACGKTVTNTLAEVLAITADGVSCGTKPVKEMYEKLNTTNKTITWESGLTPMNYLCEKTGNKVTLNFKYTTTTVIANATTIGTVPMDCIPAIDTGYLYGGNSFDKVSVGATDKSFQVLCRIMTDGSIIVANEMGTTMYGVGVTIQYFVD